MSTFSTSNPHTQPLKDKTNQIPSQNLPSNPKSTNQIPPIQGSQHTTWSTRILQVQNGTTLSNCLKDPRQDFTKGSNELVQEEIRQALTNNYRKTADGTIEMINQENLQKEKKVFGFLLKELESQIRNGKSIMNLSLPVSIYEHQSYLERQAHGLMYAPQFLEKAGAMLNSFEQFKLTIAHFVASLHLLVNPQKSFNPILGETFQGVIGGCPVYAEQITRNPGTLRMQMYGKRFLLEEMTEFEAVMSMNSVKSRRKGYTKVEYKNTGTKVYVQYPAGVTSGTVFGKRTFEFVDKFYVVDFEHRYYAEIDFEKKTEKGWFFRKNKVAPDAMLGGIWQVKQGFLDLLEKNINDMASMKVKFNENEHAMAKIEGLEGCWLETLKIGGEEYWRFGEIWPNKLEYFDNPLPSDSNNRLDILYLRAGDEGKSQEWKKEIEEREISEKKLREEKK